MSELKLCKDCRFVEPINKYLGNFEFAKCSRTKTVYREQDPITGKVIEHTNIDYCDLARSSYDEKSCGIQANFFEPKPEVKGFLNKALIRILKIYYTITNPKLLLRIMLAMIYILILLINIKL